MDDPDAAAYARAPEPEDLIRICRALNDGQRRSRPHGRPRRGRSDHQPHGAGVRTDVRGCCCGHGVARPGWRPRACGQPVCSRPNEGHLPSAGCDRPFIPASTPGATSTRVARAAPEYPTGRNPVRPRCPHRFAGYSASAGANLPSQTQASVRNQVVHRRRADTAFAPGVETHVNQPLGILARHSLQYYEERHRQQQIHLLKKRAAKLGLQIVEPQVA